MSSHRRKTPPKGDRDGAIEASRGAAGQADFVAKLRRAFGERPIPERRLKGPAPARLAFGLEDVFSGDAARAEAMLTGRYCLRPAQDDAFADAAALVCAPGENPFDAVKPADTLFEWLNAWRFLRDLAALDVAHGATPKNAGADGASMMADLVTNWLATSERYAPETWTPRLAGERLLMLFCYGGRFLPGADAVWRSRVLASAARQTRYLAHAGHRAETAFDRLTAAVALCVAGAGFDGYGEAHEQGIELLRRETRLQVRADGGHVSRNPSRQLLLAARLQMAADAIAQKRETPPAFLQHVLAKTLDHLEMFRLSDGGLALFNGGYEDDRVALAKVLAPRAAESRPIGFARYSGYQRVEAVRSTLVVEIGAPNRAGAPARSLRKGHAGGGSFHFSVGKSRLIVNCGAGAHLTDEWRDALKQPSAHSTLSCEHHDDFRALMISSLSSCRREESDLGHLIEIDREFDGGSKTGGRETKDEDVAKGRRDSVHRRRLYLARSGDELIGEDSLIEFSPKLAAHWRLRFHLHPDVKALLSRDGRSVLLATPGGDGWRFRTNCRNLRIEKSVYCGDEGPPRPAEQIVLAGLDLEAAVARDMVVKWGFRRVTELR